MVWSAKQPGRLKKHDKESSQKWAERTCRTFLREMKKTSEE